MIRTAFWVLPFSGQVMYARTNLVNWQSLRKEDGSVFTVANALDFSLRCAFVLNADRAALFGWMRCHVGRVFPELSG